MVDSLSSVEMPYLGEEHQRSEIVLELNSLAKRFPFNNGGRKKKKDYKVIDGINLTVREGEFVTIIGPSGCGKSTLLNIIAGSEPFDSGDVVVRGHSANSGPDIAIIFQEDALFPWLTVKENVEFALRQIRGISNVECEKLARKYIELVELGDFTNLRIHELSGGMKQRVAIARGLALNPRILLMDEPFGALDARTRQVLQREIQQIHAKTKKTILFVTHDVREAVSLADRVVVLTRCPARIKRKYVVELPRPRDSEDPALQALTNAIMKELKDENYLREEEKEDEQQYGTARVESRREEKIPVAA